MKAVIYIHGRNGDVKRAEHYKTLFTDSEIFGFDYKSDTPWEAMEEFPKYFDSIYEKYKEIIIVANSLGAYFTMLSLSDKPITKAFFISPVVDLEEIILNMMKKANVTEEMLLTNGEIASDFGDIFSFKYVLKYLSYVREHKLAWKTPTHILYGEHDHIISQKTAANFAKKIAASFTVMKGGEHWFHTDEQMRFLDKWIDTHLMRYETNVNTNLSYKF